jgi:hypothetical protein
VYICIWGPLQNHLVLHSLIRVLPSKENRTAMAVVKFELAQVELTENVSSHRDNRVQNYDDNTIVDIAAGNKGDLEDAGNLKLATDGHVSISPDRFGQENRC